jgi:murein DD-endopeptidase MepM/ murein hydrolase activator NlpD
VVVHAGSGGKAAGWAGNYVVIKHADGTQTLYAHMSSISVQSGTRVIGGTRLGQVGQTGRAFGPHLHFEVYPAGAEPGDVYSAVNPQPWLNKLGLKP